MLKFCDPHAFDYPYIKEMLEAQEDSLHAVGYGSGTSSGRTVADAFRNIYPNTINDQ